MHIINLHIRLQQYINHIIHCTKSWRFMSNHHITSHLCFMFYQQFAAKQQLVDICFYSEAENQHFHPAGVTRCTNSREFGVAERRVGPLGRAKFHLNLCTGDGMQHQIWKLPLFGKDSSRKSEPFDRFIQALWAFMRPNTLQRFFF